MFFFLISQVHSCTIRTEFTDCSFNSMAVIITPEDCPDSTKYIKGGLPCNFTCEANSFLTISDVSSTLKCEPCPKNTFNLGGGVSYTSWMNFKDNFLVSCWILEPTGWTLSSDCTNWHASSDSLLVSGTGPADAWYETDLTLYAKLVKSGSVEINYRKATNKIESIESGDFYVFIDEVMEFYDYSVGDFNWKRKRFNLNAGIHKVSFVFDKFVTNQTSEVQISSVIVKGTTFADFDCINCKLSDKNDPGICIFCEIGSYFSNTELNCVTCPKGQTSFPGATDVLDCFQAANCTNEDWHFYYSDCEGGKQEKIFEWNEPQMCDFSKISLPATETVDCLPCGPGKYYVGSTCQHCPNGMFSLNGRFGESCWHCEKGKHASKISDFSLWSQFPEEFQVGCVKDGEKCNYDWETRGTFLVSSPVFEEGWQVSLMGCFDVIEEDASVSFEFSVSGVNSRFSFFINGVLYLNSSETEKKIQSFGLSTGKMCLSWVFTRKIKGENCSIFRISVRGTATGGGDKCVDCPPGYFSTESTEFCEKCPAGMVSTENNTQCEFCPDQQFLDINGKCQNCLSGLILSEQQQSCVLENSLLHINNSTFTLQNFSGTPGQSPFYCSEQKLQMYCHQTFYGPIQGASHFFYLSVFNPSNVSMSAFPQSFKGPAYSFAIIDLKVMSLEYFSIDKPGAECDKSYSKAVVNLGTQVESISKDKEFGSGFKIVYENGDLCTGQTRFKTLIHFGCDKEEQEGWPIFLQVKNCVFEFYWPTVHACEICTEEMKVVHEGTCENSQVTVHKFAGKNCVLENAAEYEESIEKCSYDRVYRTWPFIMSMLLSGVMLFVVVFTIILACKKRSGYQKLVQYTMESKKVEAEEMK